MAIIHKSGLIFFSSGKVSFLWPGILYCPSGAWGHLLFACIFALRFHYFTKVVTV